MKIINWNDYLNDAIYDEAVGIRIKKLMGERNFSTYITEILPDKFVKAHYHKKGAEHYHIMSGTGEITLTNLTTRKKEKKRVEKYHSFSVPENTIHSLKNIGKEPLLLIFSCPESHLDEDRHTV